MYNNKKNAASVVAVTFISILIVILTVVAVCIFVLKTMPDSIGAFYLRDLIEIVQERFGIGV